MVQVVQQLQEIVEPPILVVVATLVDTVLQVIVEAVVDLVDLEELLFVTQEVR
jgi:hypothetical protein